MTDSEKLDLILRAQCRLFWFIPQAPGVPCPAEDVRLFCGISTAVGGDASSNEKIALACERKSKERNS